ncbi:DgyrCDS5939 [Dimorphilus gyrociliatus]|uniref:DgyrCDS5939 n=1 Tax=Dimorphilus gyrociliatus TaxID=2664684 RepID=A0A7I8VLI9_9ANNE|nr:DgyrCDS5939 [Dimorphilus gyrociliatus]
MHVSYTNSVEFKDLQATALGIDCNKNSVILAGRKSIAVVDLEKTEIVQKFVRNSKCDVSALHCSPFESQVCAIATVQKAEICELNSCRVRQTLKGHTRTINDLAWSPENPNRIATCSSDASTFLWDLRTNKPVKSLQAFAGASQVQWNKVSNDILATTHDGDIRIWDIRKGNTPVHYITAHLSKIHGLDWSYTKQRTELLTWSKDQKLHILEIDNSLQKTCGEPFPEVEEKPTECFSPKVATTLSSISNGVNSDNQIAGNTVSPTTSLQEFELANFDNLEHVCVQSMDQENVTCTVVVSIRRKLATVKITFPDKYVSNVTPTFEFMEDTNLNAASKRQVSEILVQTAEQRVRNNGLCLESCVRRLEKAIESLPDEQIIENGSMFPTYFNRYYPGVQEDSRVPYPRHCGARFSSVGLLVCFTHPSIRRGDEKTPRCLEQFHYPDLASSSSSSYFGRSTSPDRIFNLYQNDPWIMSTSRMRTKSRLTTEGSSHKKTIDGFKKTQTVVIYNMVSALSVNRQLAEQYILDRYNLPRTCSHNAQAAANVGRRDLFQAWSVLGVAVDTSFALDKGGDYSRWSDHPMGVSMIKSLLEHYLKLGDIQTVAMISAALSPVSPPQTTFQDDCSQSTVDTPEQHLSLNLSRVKRSNSLEEFSWPENEGKTTISEKPIPENDRVKVTVPGVLDGDNKLYDAIKLTYAEVLYRWELLRQRAVILKSLKNIPSTYMFEFNYRCPFCGETTRSIKHKEPKCLKRLLTCSICQLDVRGLASYCIECGHGGHSQHIEDWFKTRFKCPTGCDCECLLNSTALEKVIV